MGFDLPSLGWDDAFAAAYRAACPEHDLAHHRPGRALRVDRGVCTVLTADGAVRASLAGSVLARAARAPQSLPCVGDWLAVRTWPDDCRTVEAVLPRRTAVVRRTAGRDAAGRVLAANMDVAAVVEPVDPAPDLGRIERLLALAWESGARPLVILTKADLAADPGGVAGHVAEQVAGCVAGYVAEQVADVTPGVEVVAVAASRGDGLAAVRALVAPGRTLGLLGPPGAGKSTLVNSLAGATVMATQRRADGRGRHATAYRALVPIPGGGAVLVTPGLRAVGLRRG